jgi:hypothetical protein
MLHLETFDQAVVGSHGITVKGTATEGATVMIHGQSAQMTAEQWSARVGLHSGRNKITVKATLEGHRPAEASVTIIQRAKSSHVEQEISRIASKGKAEESHEGVGSTSHNEDAKLCSEHQCIGSFTTEEGKVAECADGTYSHAGGISGACSSHGGVAKD